MFKKSIMNSNFDYTAKKEDFVWNHVRWIDWDWPKDLLIYQLHKLTKIRIPSYYRLGNYKKKRWSFDHSNFCKRKIGNQCSVCGMLKKLHRHHIIPLGMGGPTIPINIMGVCKDCHSQIHNFKVGTGYQPLDTNTEPKDMIIFKFDKKNPK